MTSFGLLTLMGVACVLLLIIVSCSDMIHSPAFTAFPLMILDRFERARMLVLGLYLVLALADSVSVFCQLVQFSNGCRLGKEF